MQIRDVMQRRLTTIKASDGLSLALQIMLWGGIRHLPVTRRGRLVGVITERDILRVRQQSEGGGSVLLGTVGDAMTSPVEHIHPDADVADAAAEMTTKKIGCLPVVSTGDLIGIVTRTDVLGSIAQYPVRPVRGDQSAGSLMTDKPITAEADDRLVDAVTRMLQHGTRHVVVVDAERRVVGIVSDRDVRTAVGNPVQALEGAPQGSALASLRVSHVMTPDPRTVRESESVSAVVAILVRERFGALPVVDAQEKLLGIISYVDVLRRLIDVPAV